VFVLPSLVGSVGSVGSIGRVGGIGSVGSVGSAGSVGAVGSVGSVCHWSCAWIRNQRFCSCIDLESTADVFRCMVSRWSSWQGWSSWRGLVIVH